jgi:UBX domain-containing protein 7
MDLSAEGRVYAQRYHVHDYPHIGIIDPRTRRLMYKKEGWTQEKPLTAELFAETAMDFCSRHSFDKPPVAPRPASASALPSKRAMHEMSEDEQLQAAMRASLGDDDDEDDVIVVDDDEDDADEAEYSTINDGEDEDMKPEAAPAQAEEKPASLIDELVGIPLGDEPASGARIQLRMPDGKRIVRKFESLASVKTIYAFIAVSLSWV